MENCDESSILPQSIDNSINSKDKMNDTNDMNDSNDTIKNKINSIMEISLDSVKNTELIKDRKERKKIPAFISFELKYEMPKISKNNLKTEYVDYRRHYNNFLIKHDLEIQNDYKETEKYSLNDVVKSIEQRLFHFGKIAPLCDVGKRQKDINNEDLYDFNDSFINDEELEGDYNSSEGENSMIKQFGNNNNFLNSEGLEKLLKEKDKKDKLEKRKKKKEVNSYDSTKSLNNTKSLNSSKVESVKVKPKTNSEKERLKQQRMKNKTISFSKNSNTSLSNNDINIEKEINKCITKDFKNVKQKDKVQSQTPENIDTTIEQYVQLDIQSLNIKDGKDNSIALKRKRSEITVEDKSNSQLPTFRQEDVIHTSNDSTRDRVIVESESQNAHQNRDNPDKAVKSPDLSIIINNIQNLSPNQSISNLVNKLNEDECKETKNNSIINISDTIIEVPVNKEFIKFDTDTSLDKIEYISFDSQKIRESLETM